LVPSGTRTSHPPSSLHRQGQNTNHCFRQIRQGIANNTKGTAFVVYEDVMDAKMACDKLNGFNFQNRYLVVLYHQPDKMVKSKEDLEHRKDNLEQLKKQHGIE
jgi:pre-mRNA branch site protein p14